MKKITVFLGLACVSICAKAQVPTQDPYQNIAAAAIHINQYNFYIDSVAATNIQQVNFTATANNIIPSQAVSIAGTASGVHQLYVKVSGINGTPSITFLGNFYVQGDDRYQNAPVSANNINKYSLYIDSVTAANEQPVNFSATANNISPVQAVSIAGTASGVHQLYAKVSNTNGHFSIVNLANFYMDGDNKYQNSPAVAANINKYSFYVDSITAANEQTIAFSATANNISAVQAVSIAGTTSGVHQLYAKVISTTGNPSIVNLGNFYMDGDNKYQNVPAMAQNIQRYEFYTDSISATNAQPFNFTAAANNVSANNSISLAAVLPGVHQLYARVFDLGNRQSIVNLGNFTMDQNFRYANVAAPAPALGFMEYYVDTDPGFGAAIPVTFTAANNVNNLAIAATGTWLTAGGAHVLYIRSKQNPWSINSAVSFSVTGALPVTWRYITAELQNKNGLVKWGTAQEINTKHFIIEHGADGIHFLPLGLQNAAGNSSAQTNYVFQHYNLPAGINYYRIKQVDNNGLFSYSATVSLINKAGVKNSFVTPNPALNYCTITFSRPAEKTILYIINAKGQLIKTIAIADGKTQQQLDVSGISAGVYTVKISSGIQSESIPLIKL